MSDEYREILADVNHEIWSHWMKHQFSVMQYSKNGEWVIPDAEMSRWTRQANTPYRNLSEKEKDSDRDQADKILSVLGITTNKGE